jgi:F-box/TPR repeat protein Pof3
MYITSSPSLWCHLDLFRQNRQKFVKTQFIRSCMRYSQDKIHSARLHRFSDRNGLRILATKCKSLAYLEFLQTDLGGDSLIETAMIARNLKILKTSVAIELDLDQVTQILKHRPTLAHLEVDYLKPPRFAASWKVDLPGLQILQLNCKNRSITPLALPSPSLALLNLVRNPEEFELQWRQC